MYVGTTQKQSGRLSDCVKSFKEDGRGGFKRGFGDGGKRGGRHCGTYLENA